jgi:outer membrane protein assembly factor BamB
LHWKITGIGSGYSTPSVVGDRIYLLSNEGVDAESVQALNVADGRQIWTTRLGSVGNPKQEPSFAGARSTPTVDGELLFAVGSDGDLACVKRDDGTIRWQKNLRTEFGGVPGAWAYSESPLIDGDTLICTPGGGEATMVALNKTTGEVIWKLAFSGGSAAGFASAIVVETGGVRQYVQLIEKGLVGVDAASGRLLWHHDRAVSRYGANIPTPIADGNVVYWASAGTGGGAVRLDANDGRVAVEESYFESKLPTAIGGAVKVGGHLYGTTGQALLCVEFATGEVLWEERALGAASMLYADGRLHLHAENGEVGLVEPSSTGYRELGRFTPSDQPQRANPMEKAWAYPVVANGRLYIRDQGTLWCYDVKATR